MTPNTSNADDQILCCVAAHHSLTENGVSVFYAENTRIRRTAIAALNENFWVVDGESAGEKLVALLP